jgi:glycosyltransferase involved in cell wall biosynthesis
MGKKTKTNKNNNNIPFVSVCTPTFNRRPFIPNMFKCFKHQDYPMDKIEWIILDDGTDPIEDLIKEANIPQIKYIKLDEKLPLGKKRNILHENSKGDFIVYMDDDDYYPPCRISHAVDMLQKNPKALCAGASEIYIYFKHINQMIQFGPYGPNHATAGTFAFRKELLKEHKYEDHAALAEEKAFLKNYTVPFVQLEPKKVILVFSHIHNTFDKKKLLNNPHPKFVKTSDKTVDEFVKEDDIKNFFMNEIEELLVNYKPGDPSMKPDVLKQISEIEEKRRQMSSNNNNGSIVLQQDGKEPIQLTQEQVLQHLNEQNKKMQELVEILKQRDKTISILQEQLKCNETSQPHDTTPTVVNDESKLDQIITMINNNHKEIKQHLKTVKNNGLSNDFNSFNLKLN